MPCRRPAAVTAPGQLLDPSSAGEHVTEPPREVQTEVVRVRDRNTSEKVPRQHCSPSPRKQRRHASAGGREALGWHIVTQKRV